MKREQQLKIEQKYASKNVWGVVKESIDPEHEVITRMEELITDYRTKTYSYESKQQRIDSISLHSQDIAEIICAAVLMLTSMSPIQAVATRLAHHLKFDSLLDGIKTSAELLAVCEASGLYTIYKASDPNNVVETLGIEPNYQLEASIRKQVDGVKYLPPMLCNPNRWITAKRNKGGGNLLHSGDSVILGHLNHHKKYQNLHAINVLQNISWSLNELVDLIEKPNKPESVNTPEKLKQFECMAEQSTLVYDNLIKAGNEFFFVWKYDKRGRMYSQGYHCNIQGSEYKKAILNFTKEELIQ